MLRKTLFCLSSYKAVRSNMCSLNLITCPSVKISIFLVQEYTISTQYTKLHENILNLKTFYKINVCYATNILNMLLGQS